MTQANNPRQFSKDQFAFFAELTNDVYNGRITKLASLGDSESDMAFLYHFLEQTRKASQSAQVSEDSRALLGKVADALAEEIAKREPKPAPAPVAEEPKAEQPAKVQGGGAAAVVGGAKEWNREVVLNLFETNQKALERAVVCIYGYQTADEQVTKETAEKNGMGFNGADANILSSFAEQIKRGRTLSPKQLEIAKKKMRKYAGQIVRHIQANAKSN